MPKKVIVDGKDLSEACYKVDHIQKVGTAPAVILHLHARDVTTTHDAVIKQGHGLPPASLIECIDDPHIKENVISFRKMITYWRLNVDDQILEIRNADAKLIINVTGAK